MDVDLSRTLQVGGDAEGDSLLNFSGVLGSDSDDILSGSGDGIFLGGGGGDDYISASGNLTYVWDGGGEDTIVTSGGRVYIDLEDDAASDTVIAGRQTTIHGGEATDRIVVRLSELRLAAWIILNETAPTEGQFAADETRAIAILGGVKDEFGSSNSYFARHVLYYDYVNGHPWGEATWQPTDWAGDHPPARIEIAYFIQPGGWLRVMVCLMLFSYADLDAPLVQRMVNQGYPLRTAYDSGRNKTVAAGFAVADISIDGVGDGQFGITLYESGSASAFSHIWNNGNYVTVPNGPPSLS